MLAALKFSPSTITRWREGMIPRPAYLETFSRFLGFNAEWFYLPNREFINVVSKLDRHKQLLMDYRNVEQKIILGATEKWKHLWDECAERHVGSYLMYSRLLSGTGQAAISLLRVVERTDRGIRFDICNVDKRVPAGKDPIIYRYSGLMFPVGQCLFFCGDELSGDEPISMITSAAQVPGQSTLCGHFVAIGVLDEVRKPAGTKMAAYFRTKKMLELGSVMDEVGIVPVGSLDKAVQAQI